MTNELKELYAQLESLEPYQRQIEAIQGRIEYIKATYKHKDAEFVSGYYGRCREWIRVMYCKDCDTRFEQYTNDEW